MRAFYVLGETLCERMLFLQYFITFDKHIETSGTQGQTMRPSDAYTV